MKRLKIYESKSMKLIHEIRRKNYEETKDMTSEEYIHYIKTKVSKTGLKLPLVKKSLDVK